MNFNNRPLSFGLAAAVVGFAIAQYVAVRRIETAKRQEIERNMQLDILAIKRAGAIIEDRRVRGEYKYAYDLLNDFNQEVKLQEMEVRL